MEKQDSLFDLLRDGNIEQASKSILNLSKKEQIETYYRLYKELRLDKFIIALNDLSIELGANEKEADVFVTAAVEKDWERLKKLVEDHDAGTLAHSVVMTLLKDKAVFREWFGELLKQVQP